MEFGDHQVDLENERKHFESDLKNSSKETQAAYSAILLDENIRLTRENHRITPIPLDRKKELLDIARSTQNISEARQVVRMGNRWDAATDRETGRPPIGGAIDD